MVPMKKPNAAKSSFIKYVSQSTKTEVVCFCKPCNQNYISILIKEISYSCPVCGQDMSIVEIIVE